MSYLLFISPLLGCTTLRSLQTQFNSPFHTVTFKKNHLLILSSLTSSLKTYFMLSCFSFLIFTFAKLNFKLSFSSYIYVHRKRLNQTAESSCSDPKACNPSFWSKGRKSSDFFLSLRRTLCLMFCSLVPLLSCHYLHLYDFHGNGTATALSNLSYKMWTEQIQTKEDIM